MHDWGVTEADRELFARELDSFVPRRIFDAHAHLYCTEHFPTASVPPLCKAGPQRVGMDAFQHSIGELIPGRETDGLFFPYPQSEVDV
ncbi:MAG: hypothetical protein HY000_10880, partial [Planctomycetes bacterium]|nr:hypothetical protein [Planctomycetota bacterium]